jgi:hypothetical protein
MKPRHRAGFFMHTECLKVAGSRPLFLARAPGRKFDMCPRWGATFRKAGLNAFSQLFSFLAASGKSEQSPETSPLPGNAFTTCHQAAPHISLPVWHIFLTCIISIRPNCI